MEQQQQQPARGRGGGRGGSSSSSGPGRGGGRGGGRNAAAAAARGGRGRDGGGRGGGGRGRGDSGGYGNTNNNYSKQDRKQGRRQKQLDAMAKKASEEDRYFRQCQLEARNRKKQSAHYSPTPSSLKDDTNQAREAELYGKQIVKGINFEKYNDIRVEVKIPNMDGKETVPVMENFGTLQHLTPQLQRNIQLMKYSHPTPIQKHAIPLAMSGEDLMCCAQTGSGKTCAFLLPVVAHMVGGQQQQQQQQNNNNSQNDNNNNNHHNDLEPAKPKCVVLAPTRELASQIELEAQKLTHAIPSIQPVVVYGGANARPQLKDLAIASGSDNDLIVVATPGRLTDFVDRNLISLSQVQYLILDEADRMLDMGFEPQIRKLVQRSGMTPKEQRQTLLFSATFPPAIQTLAAEFQRPYVWIAVGRVGSTTDSITQVIVEATPDKRHKLRLVVDALEKGPDGRTLVFVQKKRTATWLKKQLNKGGPDNDSKQGHPGGHRNQNIVKPGQEIKFKPIPAEEIHGDRTQGQREAALDKFRSGKCMVLVATDVAARGLDIGGVEHVINMDLPNAQDDFDSYVHRIGRTGRAGHKGLATSLFVPGDDPKNCNGRIAKMLVGHLKESEQEVPSFLEGMVAGGGGSSSGNTKAGPQFGGTDVRKNSSRPSRVTNTEHNGRGRGRGRGGRDTSVGNNSDGTQGKERGRGPPGGANHDQMNARKQARTGAPGRADHGGRSAGRGRGRASGGRGRGGAQGRGNA